MDSDSQGNPALPKPQEATMFTTFTRKMHARFPNVDRTAVTYWLMFGTPLAVLGGLMLLSVLPNRWF
jgi:hypothetical protein